MDMDERRDSRRFETPDTAMVGLGPYSREIGHIMEISMTGLSFNYVSDNKPTDNLHELDLFMAGSPFYLYKIQCETVWDTDTVYESRFTSHNIRMRGVKFKDLSSTQKSQLEYFIENHSVGDAP